LFRHFNFPYSLITSLTTLYKNHAIGSVADFLTTLRNLGAWHQSARTVKVETIIANEPPVDDLRQRYLRFDVACRTEKGELVNVEMSLNPGKSEKVRLEYYAARLFSEQDIHGDDQILIPA